MTSPRLICVAVLLAIGFSVSVIVAWSFAYLGPIFGTEPRTYFSSEHPPLSWSEQQAIGWVQYDIDSAISKGEPSLIGGPPLVSGYPRPAWDKKGVRKTLPRYIDLDRQIERPILLDESWIVNTTGWPKPCLSQSLHITGLGWTITDGFTVRGQLEFGPDGELGFVALPYRILWSGLIIDCAVYAIVVYTSFKTFLWLRRKLRKRRGVCPNCGYAFHEYRPCPECGCRM